MQIALIGLGRMGANMARRLLRGGHDVVVHDRDMAAADPLVKEGARAAASLDEVVTMLEAPRTVWVMVPSGDPTEATVSALGERLAAGDAVIDGGNSYFKDDIRRGQALAARGIAYLDAGTSGGVWGLDRGYCLMVGGPKDQVERLAPIFRTLAPGVGDVARTPGRDGDLAQAEEGWLHCGPVGAGHFVKMVHNGIEYGLMQAYAEGFDLMRSVRSEQVPEEWRYELDTAAIAEVWRRGSVVTSWLLDLTAQALIEQPDLDRYSGFVNDSGEGRWTVQTAVEAAVPAPVLTTALFTRFRSRQQATFADKVLSAMREKFGGHREPK
ncbi:MAG TPA: decarboxylating 6-phosphogluconate dehydrogenase [Luteitalea sp.]|nr:decarboxylating 6-phosphogluconate dehydrogenase [Luteitalea sp.]